MSRDCFVTMTTAKRKRGDRMKFWDVCAANFNMHVRPVHPDVPLLIYSEGDDDLPPTMQNELQAMLDGPVEFRVHNLQPQDVLDTPEFTEWELHKKFDVGYRGMSVFFARLGLYLQSEFDYVFKFDDDSYFLSPLPENLFDRLRRQGASFAFRGVYPERPGYVKGLVESLGYDGEKHKAVPGLAHQTYMRQTLYSNFFVARTGLWLANEFHMPLTEPEIIRDAYCNRWNASAILTALVAQLPPDQVKLWTDFVYAHGPPDTLRHTIAAEDNASFVPVRRYGRPPRERPARRQREREEKVQTLGDEHRNKALVVIGDGLGNVIEQTPLVYAVSQMFAETNIWLPRSRPDIPSLLQGMPNVNKVSTSWEVDFDNSDVMFGTWLAARKVKGQEFPGGRYIGGSPLTKQRSEADVCLDPVRRVGWEGDMPPYYIGWDEWPDPADYTHDGPIIGITTGRLHRPMWRFKAYPPVSYARMVELLQEQFRGKARFIQLGWEHDQKIPHDAVIDTRHRGTLRQTMGLVSCCNIFVGNDTGLCHASAALGVPTVVVFGPTLQSKALPPKNAVAVSAGLECQPCQPTGMGRYPKSKRKCDHECMQTLDPAKIAEAVTKAFVERYGS